MKKKKLAQLPDDEQLLNIFKSHRQPLRLEHIMSFASVPGGANKKLEKDLKRLASEGLLGKLPGGYYSLPEKARIARAEYLASPNSYGKARILEPAEMRGKELYISQFQNHGAWHNDIVDVAILPGHCSKGKIINVVERRQKEIPAIFEEKSKRSLVFSAADGRINMKFRAAMPKGEKPQIQPGDLALIAPEKMLERGLWQATILNWLGPADRIAAQEFIVKKSQNVPTVFPELAFAQARALGGEADAAAAKDREDMRQIPFVTIDGADARDFDDAIYVEKKDGGFLLRVAIADVSHYVLPDKVSGSLDQEARTRGNSWYFPRSVEPMLPEALSNGLCSLRPDEDRLAMVVEIFFNKDGQPLESRFTPALIRSHGRLIYDDVAAFFSGGKNAVADGLHGMLNEARELYELLARQRRMRGTLDFQMPEAAYKFDDEGKLVSMKDAERTDANQLIEEFMIAANEAVAEYLGKKSAPFLYRIHPEPEQDKLKILYETLSKIAPDILPAEAAKTKSLAPGDIQKILMKAKDTPQEYVVNRMCLRSMGQARYQPRNIGHFGLASPAYCHFTSPIRRYADLLAHRSLKAALGNGMGALANEEELAAIGDDLNALERRAVECEREMAKRMACLALAGKEGEIFKGTISGVTDFGLFVEFADLPAEGLIRMDELGAEWFELDQGQQCLIGQASGRIWRLGQPVECALMAVNLEKQEISLRPVSKPEKSGHKGKRRPEKRGGKGHASRAHYAKSGRDSGKDEKIVGMKAKSKNQRKRKK